MKIARLFIVSFYLLSVATQAQTPQNTPTDFYNQVVTPYNAVWQNSARLLSVMVHHYDNKMVVETEVSGLKSAILAAKTNYEALPTQSPSEQKLKAEAISMTLNLPVQLGLVDLTKSCDEPTTAYRRLYQSLLQRESYDKNLTAMMDNFSKALDTFAKEGHLALLPKSKQNERDSMAKALNLIHKLRKTLCEVMIPLEDFFKAAKPETTKEAGKSIGELKKVLAQKEREMLLIQSELSEPNTPFEPMQLFMNQINEFAGRKKMGAIMQYLQDTENSNAALRINYESAYDFFTKNVYDTITQFEASIEAYQKRKVPDVLTAKN